MSNNYLNMFLEKIKELVIYKTSYIFSILFPFINIYIYYLIWSKFLTNIQDSIYTEEKIFIYLMIGGILNIVFSPTSIFMTLTKIRSGALPYYVLKSFNILISIFSDYIGSSSIFIIVISAWLLITTNFIGTIYLVISLILYFFIVITIGNSAIYILNTWLFRFFLSIFVLILGGTAYPLDVLPEKLFSIIKYNPISMIFYHNIKIISGYQPTIELFFYLIFWTLFFFALFKITFKNRLKKYQGLGF